MTERPLRHNADFLKLWAGQTISLVGSRVTLLALPLTAIVTLHAGAAQMGLLEALGSAPSLLLSLPAGAWTDRVRRRPLMIAASLGQAALLFSIPLAAWLGLLHLAQLYVVTFLVASLALLFKLAYRSFLPALVVREQLVEANSRLAASASVAQVAGPGLGGALVQLLSAPVAILADSLSFLLSALGLLTIRSVEPAPALTDEADMRREVAEGLRLVLGNQILRSLVGASATFNLFDGVLFAVYVLYMSRTLHLNGAAIGLVFGLAGAGGLLGALLVAPITERLGLGRALLWGVVLATVGEMLIAVAGGPVMLTILILVLAEGAVELGAALYSINNGSLQQAITPAHFLGRVTAGSELVSIGVGPFGALLGGMLGQLIGLRQTVAVAGLGTLLCLLWILFSPVRSMRTIPTSTP